MKYYIAKHERKEVYISERELLSDDLWIVIHNLNNAGFDLGSGHDGATVKKEHFGYRLVLTPFVGVTQTIDFKLKK